MILMTISKSSNEEQMISEILDLFGKIIFQIITFELYNAEVIYRISFYFRSN